MPKAMIVDDDRLLRQMFEQILKQYHFSVQTAADGREALSLLATYQPDLILIDMYLPEIHGQEVVAQVRANGRYDKTRIIAITAYPGAFSPTAGGIPGADACLLKPVSVPELLTVINGFKLFRS